MKNKIGIMGGTFNPIHNGHLTLALKAYKQFNLEKVLVMISPNPPHKADKDILDINKRVDMVKLAVNKYPGILEFSDFELERGKQGYIYTAETLTLLNKLHPENQYYFILGGDSLRDIEKWYRPDIVLDNAIILAAIREDMDLSAIYNHIERLTDIYGCDIRVLTTDDIPISSTNIRQRLELGKDITNMVPAEVAEYLLKGSIYK